MAALSLGSDAAEPLVCQTALGGSIDPDPFRDSDGILYLYFKNDGNNPAAFEGARFGAAFNATSPGIAITATPRSPTAARMAFSSTNGIWAGSDTSSQ